MVKGEVKMSSTTSGYRLVYQEPPYPLCMCPGGHLSPQDAQECPEAQVRIKDLDS